MRELNLLVNWYDEKRPNRRAEIDFCLQANLGSRIIDRLIVVVSPSDRKCLESMLEGTAPVQSQKLVVIEHGQRPTFNFFFQIMNQYPESINVIANLDIVLDMQTFGYVKDHVWIPKMCFALSRWDFQNEDLSIENAKLFNRMDSQDTWVFFGSIKSGIHADFPLGMCGCDNVIAHLLWGAGIPTYNISKSLKTYHLHLSGVRNYLDINELPKEKLPPPYKYLPVIGFEEITAAHPQA